MSRETLRARVAAATEGPWEAEATTEYRTGRRTRRAGPVIFGPAAPVIRAHADAEDADAAFIANARQDIPALLRLADAVAELMCHEVGWNGESPYWVYTGSPASLLRTMRDALADLEALP